MHHRIAALAVALAAAAIITACAPPPVPAAPAAQAAPPANDVAAEGDPTVVSASVGLQLAVIDGDGTTVLDEDAVEALRANFLVDAIAPRCNLIQKEVANLALGGWNTLRVQYGLNVTVRELLEEMNEATLRLVVADCVTVVTTLVDLKVCDERAIRARREC